MTEWIVYACIWFFVGIVAVLWYKKRQKYRRLQAIVEQIRKDRYKIPTMPLYSKVPWEKRLCPWCHQTGGRPFRITLEVADPIDGKYYWTPLYCELCHKCLFENSVRMIKDALFDIDFESEYGLTKRRTLKERSKK